MKTTKAPTTQTEVRSFLGLVNFCRKFIKDYSTITAPLRRLTKKNEKFSWGKEEQESFDELKKRLCGAEVLAYYRPHAETKLIVDASPVGLGAILTQMQEDGEYRPVSYSSYALNETEMRYSQIEREALAILFGCMDFHFFLYDKDFVGVRCKSGKK